MSILINDLRYSVWSGICKADTDRGSHFVPTLKEVFRNASSSLQEWGLNTSWVKMERVSNSESEHYDPCEILSNKPDLTMEEILEAVKKLRSHHHAARYARAVADQFQDDTLYDLVLGTYEMYKDFGGSYEEMMQSLQEGKSRLLDELF